MQKQSKFFKFGISTPTSQTDYIGSMTVEQTRIITSVGQEFTVKAHCSLPLNENFAVPLKGLYGSEGRTINLAFVNGVAERKLTFDKSGEWQVTEDEINAYLQKGQWFHFDGLTISVAE